MPAPTPTPPLARLVETARRWRDAADDVGGAFDFGRTGTDVLVAAAVECLLADVDSPALRELAGLRGDEAHSQVEPLLDDTLHELGVADDVPPAGTTVGLEGLRAFLALVLRDAAALGLDGDLDVVPETRSLDQPHATYLVVPGGCSWLHGGDDDLTPAQELERVADLVHEWIVEELPGRHLRTNWPRCPDHPDTHPLEVRRHEDVVAWTCPRTGTPHARVGALPPVGG
ncbi:hypothetical protein [Nocardioides sp. 1609]|uniref:hypothetical protein n=1 Tax=Nocardioides sp. 1609 TaxID=2508327 RepID=UPI00107002E4|nr:hypothetical protein [Nocardioides sp. 1609]